MREQRFFNPVLEQLIKETQHGSQPISRTIKPTPQIQYRTRNQAKYCAIPKQRVQPSKRASIKRRQISSRQTRQHASRIAAGVISLVTLLGIGSYTLSGSSHANQVSNSYPSSHEQAQAAVYYRPVGKTSHNLYSSSGANTTQPSVRESRYLWPLEHYKTVCSGYGNRIFLGKPNFHEALDIPAPTGTPIRTIADGEVVSTESDAYGAKTVYVKHPDGMRSGYVHLQDINVSKGSVIRKGQVVGTVGVTGLTTGPHLHFFIEREGRKIDPKTMYR